MTWKLRRFFIGFVGLWSMSAVFAADVQISAPDGAVTRLAPGESAVFRLRVQAATSVWVNMMISSAADDEYDVAQIGNVLGCAPLEPTSGIRYATFDPTVAAGDLECSYAIRRNVDSINDLSVNIMALGGMGLPIAVAPPLRFGYVPDLRLDIRQDSVALLPDGRAENISTLTVRQTSPVGVDGLRAGSCLTAPPDVDIDGSIPGGCGDANQGESCLVMLSYGFRLPTVPAIGQTTCRVRLTSREPYAAPLYLPMRLSAGLLVRDPATGGALVPGTLGRYGMLRIDVDAVFADGFD